MSYEEEFREFQDFSSKKHNNRFKEVELELEYITCEKCKIQQSKENFRYCFSRHKVCKSCNKKTNIIPRPYTTTTKEAIKYLRKIIYDERNKTSIFIQTQMVPMFEFLDRQYCKEQEAKNDSPTR